MVVLERGLVDAAHVLLAVRLDELVVDIARLPAVDDEIAPGDLGVAEKFRADVAAAGAEERRPFALRAVDALELRGVSDDVVAEDEGDQRRPPRSWWALKKFSLPAVAIEAEALISRHSAAAATIWAKR